MEHNRDDIDTENLDNDPLFLLHQLSALLGSLRFVFDRCHALDSRPDDEPTYTQFLGEQNKEDLEDLFGEVSTMWVTLGDFIEDIQAMLRKIQHEEC